MTSQTTGLIVDTDVGFDDFLAIAFLLTQPSVRIEAFTVVNGICHVSEGARALLLLQEHAGISPAIPVYKGRRKPLRGTNEFPKKWRNQATQVIQKMGWGAPTGKAESIGAVDFLKQRLSNPSNPAQILALGPLTNIGATLRMAPGSAAAIQSMVAMGGAVGVKGNIPKHPDSEGNMYVDPRADEIVFASAVKPLLVPLNATSKVPLGKQFVNSFQSSTPVGQIVKAVLEIIETEFLDKNYPYDAWDPLASMAVAVPSVLQKVTPMALMVEQGGKSPGKTSRDPAGPANAQVAMSAQPKTFRTEFKAAFA